MEMTMGYCLRLFFKRVPRYHGRFLALLLCTGLLLLPGCQFTTDIKLENNKPRLLTDSVVEKTLLYPDTTLFTFRVQDLNDTMLTMKIITSTDTLGSDTVSWPGSCARHRETGQISNWTLSLNNSFLGFCSGRITVTDPQNDSTVFTVKAHRQLEDPFKTFPENTRLWSRYSDVSLNYGFDYIDSALRFYFDTIADSSSKPQNQSAGLHSVFRLSGDLEASVKFQLRSDMTSKFETAFFISTSPDTSRWDGEVAGIFITGTDNYVKLMTKSYPLQTRTNQTTNFGGILTIKRVSDSVKFIYNSVEPDKSPIDLLGFTYPANDTVFVHLRMQVDDRSKIRSCTWMNFTVTKGKIVF
jgi:hypothetical protein